MMKIGKKIPKSCSANRGDFEATLPTFVEKVREFLKIGFAMIPQIPARDA